MCMREVGRKTAVKSDKAQGGNFLSQKSGAEDQVMG